MNQGCLLKEAVASRTLALIAGKRSNLSRGLQESKTCSIRHLKAPRKDCVLFSFFQEFYVILDLCDLFWRSSLCCCDTQAEVPGL